MMPIMAAISGIEPAAGALPPPPRDQKGAAATANFGAAVSHRELAQEHRRVAPAAVADKKRETARMRGGDTPRQGKGSHIDIRV
jgi:hypothetical protein